MDDVVTAYVADSAASAPPPRGLPLSVQAPSRHSAVAHGARPVGDVAGAAVSGDDWEDSAAPALTPPGTGDDEGPPLEELEAQMRGDVLAQEAASSRGSRDVARVRPAASDDDDEVSSAPLPELDSLVARLPTDVRETLDELFRARFVSVKKLPRRVFTSVARRS